MAPDPEEDLMEKNLRLLNEDNIALINTYGLGPYSTSIKRVEKEIKEMEKKVRNSVPIYMLSLMEILAFVSLLASCSYPTAMNYSYL